MKELVNLGSRFISFRDDATTLRGKALPHLMFFYIPILFLDLHLSVLPEVLHRTKDRANDLEEKLRASEEAREKAEEDAAGVKDLRRRLQAAEDALSDREDKLVQHDNDIITRLETQSRRFSSNTTSPFVIQLFLVLKLSLMLMKSFFSPAGKMGEHYHLNQEPDEDRVLDSLAILELNCNLARECLTSTRNALRHIFPHFFPKTTQPEIFAQLAQHFLIKDDPALAYRQA
jgi:hypothetical protein